MWRQAPPAIAASRMLAFGDGQTSDCTVDRTRLSSAAAIPAPMPVRITAVQKRKAFGIVKVVGIPPDGLRGSDAALPGSMRSHRFPRLRRRV